MSLLVSQGYARSSLGVHAKARTTSKVYDPQVSRYDDSHALPDHSQEVARKETLL